MARITIKIKTLGSSILPTFLGGSYGEPLRWGAIWEDYPGETGRGYPLPGRASRECIPPKGGPWALGQPPKGLVGLVPMAPKGMVNGMRQSGSQRVGSRSVQGSPSPSDPRGGPMAPPCFGGEIQPPRVDL